MRALREDTLETVLLGTLSGAEGIVIEQISGKHPFRFVVDVGVRFALHTAAPGKAMLATLPQAEAEAIIAQMPFTRFNARTITDGNPGLKVTGADNLDLSTEYYLKPLGVVSAGLFHKEIRGFYFSTTSTVSGGDYDGYRLTRTEMGQGGKVRGLELDWQQRLSFLPGALSGLGLGVNSTWIDSVGRYPTRPGADLTFRGTAKRTGNLNVSYVRGGLDLRLFYNFRGDYLSGVGARPALDVYERQRATLDFSAKQRLARGLSAYLSAKNLTDAPKITFQGNRSNPTGVRYYDLSLNFGVTREF